MLVKLSSDIILKRDSIESPGAIFKFNFMTDSLYEALGKLTCGYEEEPTFQDENEQIHFYYISNLFKKNGLLTYQTPLIEMFSFDHENCADIKDKNALYQFSRFSFFKSEKNEFWIETSLNKAKARLLSSASLDFIYAFKKGLSYQEALVRFPHLSSKTVQETLSLLASVQILSTTEEPGYLKQWEEHDLYFHAKSRRREHERDFGATYRFKGTLPPATCIKECLKTGNPLSKPTQRLMLPFEEVLQKRKSIREHGRNPITYEQLSHFLYHCARIVKKMACGEDEISARPYPNGGARYELEIYPLVARCSGLEPGLYHYHPLEHALCQINEQTEEVEGFFRQMCHPEQKFQPPHIMFVVTARFQRVSWKYQSMAYALILKNVGALFQTMYFVATAMELAPCALEGGHSESFSRLIGVDPLIESSVGEFILGSKQ